jgi:hypothetical protein
VFQWLSYTHPWFESQQETTYSGVGFEVLIAVVMRSTVFWDIRRALLATCFYAGFLLGLFFDPEDGGDMFLRNVG